MQPDISYITSCYNGGQFLPSLLDDILERQSHKNIELIIVDSASTDNSVEIIEERQKTDVRLRLITQSKRTSYGISWLEGWNLARGKIVGNSNCDDRSEPFRSNQLLMAYEDTKFRSDSKYFFYYGGYSTYVDSACVAKGVPPPFSIDDWSQFFRAGVHCHWDNELRSLVDWRIMYRAGREYKSAFDYWLLLYFISLGVIGIPIQSCFSIYNQRCDSIEQSNKELNTFESIRAIKEFFPDGKVAQDFEQKTKFDNSAFYYRYHDFLNRIHEDYLFGRL